MTEYLSLHELSIRASMSERTIRRYLGEIPHHRHCSRGKIWIRWADFEKWMEDKRQSIVRDEAVMEILRDLARAS